MVERFAIYDKPPEGVEGATIAESLLLADRTRDAGTISMTLIKIMQSCPGLTFADLEQHLRALNCGAHLIAIPAEQAPDGIDVRNIDRSPADYSLWICVFGAAEAEIKRLAIGGFTAEQNLKNLKSTGLLMPRQELSEAFAEAREYLRPILG